jgi:hypothetical protein
VPHSQVMALAELRPRLGMAVMLDESLCGYPDALEAVEHRTADMLNVRLSKCGGVIASLRLIGLAQRSGLGLQLGCHPGETAILSAAGRHVASRIEGLTFVEGSYDRHILERNVSRDDITFGYGGGVRPIRSGGMWSFCMAYRVIRGGITRSGGPSPARGIKPHFRIVAARVQTSAIGVMHPPVRGWFVTWPSG